MRIPDYIATAQTNLLRTKLRTFLTVFAFVIGTFTLGMTTAFSQGLKAYLNTQLNAYGQANIINVEVGATKTQTSTSGIPYYQEGRQSQSATSRGEGKSAIYTLNQHDLDAVKATPHILAAYPDYNNLNVSYIQSGTSPKYILQVQSAVPGQSTNLDAGTFPSASQSNGIVVPYPYVEALGGTKSSDIVGKIAVLHVIGADQQSSKDFSATITGVLPDTAHVPGAYVSYSLLADMVQYQLGNTASYTDIIAVTDTTATKADRAAIKSALEAKTYRVQTYDDILNSFSRPLNIIQFGLDGFAAIALLAATIGIVNTLLMAVLERTQEIGLLKALGMRRSGITFIYLVEAASIGFWGGVIGVAGAALVGLGANPILAKTLFKGIGQAHILTYPPLYMLAIVGGAMVVGLLAGTLPAIRAGRLDPIDALRRE
jgi:putative ABC transport system permease protein